ncbi:hypothetical protein GGR32_002129 [Mesonia hippocampi]|uniref:Uncharacterized protein n=1 Tax=Mesonia hippocampi TaxID=1628250 RepID=A0A840ETG5_9FLAO|nr:hypothetical protein [Mesonia hippocampi]
MKYMTSYVTVYLIYYILFIGFKNTKTYIYIIMDFLNYMIVYL